MQVREKRRSIGVQCAAVASVLALAVCGVSPASAEETGNMVVFKGGFMRLNSDRGTEIFTDVNGSGSRVNNGQHGWYVGAWLDNVLSKDSWGMMSGVWAMGEIGLQFNRIASKTVVQAAPALLGNTTPDKIQLTMVTIDVAPKLKFMEGSAFRPWLIPIGLDIHVISPPSNGTQYLDVGLQFGGGFEYRVWKAIHIGADLRYHLAANMTNTTNSYFQVGPYVGIAF